MGVKIQVAERPQRELDPKAPWRFKTKTRDTRPNPIGPAGSAVLAASNPTKEQIKAAWAELLPPMNLIAYYSMSTTTLWNRHVALLTVWEKGDGKTAKGLVKQLWEGYQQVMKTGKWKPGKWGKGEPKA